MIIVKKIFYITLIMFGATLFTHASTNNDIKIIEATKNIQYLSQKISKDYLYLYYNPKKTVIKTQLNNSIKKLEENFRFVAKSTSSAEAKNILDFLSYSKDQIKEVLENDILKKSAILILDHSEALFEGAQSILDTHQYNSAKDKDIKINLMRISKFYMAIHIGINQDINKEQLQKEKKLLEKKLKGANVKLNQSWQALRELLNTKEDYFIPDIVFILVKNLENITKKV